MNNIEKLPPCECCDDLGYLDVCIGTTKSGKEKWELQACEHCDYFGIIEFKGQPHFKRTCQS